MTMPNPGDPVSAPTTLYSMECNVAPNTKLSMAHIDSDFVVQARGGYDGYIKRKFETWDEAFAYVRELEGDLFDDRR